MKGSIKTEGDTRAMMHCTMAFLLLLLLSLGEDNAVNSNIVREGNGGNCVGVKSCRPRCLSFRVVRDGADCHSRQGIFQRQQLQLDGAANGTAWQETNVVCNSAAGGIGEKEPSLLVEVREQSSYWSFATKIELLPGEDDFTFCSIYPCPRRKFSFAVARDVPEIVACYSLLPL